MEFLPSLSSKQNLEICVSYYLPPLSLQNLVTIPISPRKELALFLKWVASIVNELHAVDIHIPSSSLIKDEQVVLGREFHVSLGRTVPIRVHQRDSMVTVLRQKLQSHRRYWIDFNKWEVFVNDDCYTDISLSGSYNRRKASLRYSGLLLIYCAKFHFMFLNRYSQCSNLFRCSCFCFSRWLMYRSRFHMGWDEKYTIKDANFLPNSSTAYTTCIDH
ncbi:hypothetical protein ACS0TY_001223 [Phlomoides rotata]